MAAVAIGGAAGAFGNGWLSSARMANESLAVAYPRFARAHAPLTLAVAWPAAQPETVLWIARSYVDRFDIEEIHPPPVSVSAGTQRIYYAFQARDAGTLVEATFTLKPRSAGAIRGSLGVERGSEVEARHWVFP